MKLRDDEYVFPYERIVLNTASHAVTLELMPEKRCTELYVRDYDDDQTVIRLSRMEALKVASALLASLEVLDQEA